MCSNEYMIFSQPAVYICMFILFRVVIRSGCLHVHIYFCYVLLYLCDIVWGIFVYHEILSYQYRWINLYLDMFDRDQYWNILRVYFGTLVVFIGLWSKKGMLTFRSGSKYDSLPHGCQRTIFNEIWIKIYFSRHQRICKRQACVFVYVTRCLFRVDSVWWMLHHMIPCLFWLKTLTYLLLFFSP